LGKGGYGQVYQVRNKKTGELFACKKLSKLDINNLEKFEREIKILIQTDHPNIIKLYDVYTTINSLYLIMEECHGGELFDKILEHIENQEMYTEKEAAEIILQVMSAVEYCHNNGIVHRDLKPENLLYLKKGNEKNNPLKVIDFGLSQTLNTKKILSSKVGTAYYVSPEILAGKYNEKCDIWSCGVILYVLLSGEPPFN
jgi:calcium-dependent protein kinase